MRPRHTARAGRRRAEGRAHRAPARLPARRGGVARPARRTGPAGGGVLAGTVCVRRRAGDRLRSRGRSGGMPLGAPAPAPAGRTAAWPLRPVWPAAGLALLCGLAFWRLSAAPAPAPADAPPREMQASADAPPAAPSPREAAERLHQDGLKLVRAACRSDPCAREWLAARALFERAIAADPAFAPPYAEAAFTYANMVTNEASLDREADLTAAEGLAATAAALAPGLSTAHAARGAVLRHRPDRLEDALEAYRRAVALDSSAHPSRANAGWMLVLLGRAEEAEGHLRTSIAMAPEHPFVGTWLNYLGLAHLYLGREGNGAEHLRRSVGPRAIATNDVRALELAAALALNGQVDDARLVAGEVRRRWPEASVRWFRLRARHSWNATYLAQRERIYQGLALAGLPDEERYEAYGSDRPSGALPPP